MTCYNSEAQGAVRHLGLLSTTLKEFFIMEMIRSIPRPLVTESRCPPAQDITAEKLRELLHYDHETGIFTWKVRTPNQINIGDVAGCPTGNGYLRIKVQSRPYKAHRLAWLYMYGTWPEDQIDHINRIRTDNRIANLRAVTSKQNQQNAGKRSDNTSGHPGVCWNKQHSKWVANIRHNQKLIHLGCYSTIEEALSARKAGELKYWGAHRAE